MGPFLHFHSHCPQREVGSGQRKVNDLRILVRSRTLQSVHVRIVSAARGKKSLAVMVERWQKTAEQMLRTILFRLCFWGEEGEEFITFVSLLPVSFSPSPIQLFPSVCLSPSPGPIIHSNEDLLPTVTFIQM